MTGQLQSLLWKEWHERRMQFLMCMIWMVGGTLYCMAYEWSREFRAPAAGFSNTAMLFGLFMPLFIAMRTSLGETTDRTRSFSDALPISSRRRGWVRLVGGAGVLIVPILTGAVLLSLCLGFGLIQQACLRPPDGPGYIRLPERASLSAISAVGLVWQATAIALWAATSLYLLLSLVGTLLPKEAHAGFVGTIVVFLWFLGMGLGVELKETAELPAGQAIVGAIVPLAMVTICGSGEARGSYGDLMISSAVLGPLLANSILQLALATWFVRRYGRKLPGRAEESPKSARTTWRPWSLPLPTQSIALTWLTLRQSVPMCIPGLLLACLMTLLQTDVCDPAHRSGFLQQYADSMSSATWVIGILWAVVVGAGVFSAEIDSRIGEFWRTWPVPFWRLFAIKFFVGLVAVLLVLDGTTIAASWNSPNWGDYYCMNWPYIACILPLHATMFAVAVAWACLLRRPVIGGMAAIGTFMMVSLGLEWWETTRQFDPIEVYNNLAMKTTPPLGPIDFTAHGYPVVSAAMGVIILASIVIAGLALRRYAPRIQAS
jgi:hypothetical protein